MGVLITSSYMTQSKLAVDLSLSVFFSVRILPSLPFACFCHPKYLFHCPHDWFSPAHAHTLFSHLDLHNTRPLARAWPAFYFHLHAFALSLWNSRDGLKRGSLASLISDASFQSPKRPLSPVAAAVAANHVAQPLRWNMCDIRRRLVNLALIVLV